MKGVRTVSAYELSDPSSEDGGLSALEDETDENLPPPGKRRRGRRVTIRRIYFNEANTMDKSQLCEGMCFADAQQFRRELKSYHIVQGRDYKYIKNKADRVKVKRKQDKVKCDFFMLASQASGEKTFQLRQMIAPQTCPESRDCSIELQIRGQLQE